MVTRRRRMGGVPTKSTRKPKTIVTTFSNSHLTKHMNTARSNFNSLTADSAAISIQNKHISRNKNFQLYISKKLKSNNLSFSSISHQNAFASSILKNELTTPMSEGYSSSEETANWEEIANIFDRNMEFIYDLIPPELLQEVTNNDTPDWYINFINSEPSIANIPQPVPSEEVVPQIETSPTDDPTSPNANPVHRPAIETIDTPPKQSETSLQYMSYKPLSNSTKTILPTYYEPDTNIQKFHKEFPIPNRLYRKWKDGVPLWSNKKYAKKYKDVVTEQKTFVLNQLLNNKIITKASRCSFCSDFFLLESKGKVRPIFNYSQITKSLNPPKFYLPSLYQVIDRKKWAPNLYYVKIDFKQAFFNINISKNSSYITTFIYNKKYYKFNVLPFGIATAPFACQMLLNQITKYIKKSTEYVWGHIDDIIMAHKDKNCLTKILKALLLKLKRAGWEINLKKSVLVPTKSLTFLGATWSSKGVKRNDDISETLLNVILAMKKNLKTKQVQKIYGFLNYYLSFSKYFSSLLFRFIKEPDKIRPLILELIKLDYLSFQISNNQKTVNAFSDATPTKLGGITGTKKHFSIPIQEMNIMLAETLAAIITIVAHKKGTKLLLFTDNMATLSFLKKGRAKFLLRLEPFNHFKYCMTRYLLDENYKLNFSYIKSENNPADFFSRN